MKNRFEIKKVQTFEGHDGYGMNCTVYVDGKPAFDYHDDAWGGGGIMRYPIINKELTAVVEKHIAEMPEEEMEFKHDDGTPMMIKPNLDSFVHSLFEAYEKAKFQRSLQRRMKDSIVVMEKGNESEYRYYKFKVNLSQLHPDALKRHVDAIKTKLQPNEYIINTF